MTRICYFGAFDPQYPRNQILRHGLSHHGYEVVAVNARRGWPTVHKVPFLARAFRRDAQRIEAIILAEFGQSLAGLAWMLARWRGIPLVVDFFTSMYESAVHDRMEVEARSPTARRLRTIDALALRVADVVLVDTGADANYFAREFSLPLEKMRVIPVGAFVEWFHPDVQPVESHVDGLLVHFYGTYIPLHGIETILQAAALLRDRTNLCFELLGRGQMYPQMRQLAARLGVTNVSFADPVPPPDLPAHVARANICLGIFGATDKAQRVMPNKLYQTLAMRKPVISGDTPALREGFEPGAHLLAVPVADPEALAEAILKLANDTAQRTRLAEAGYQRIRERFTPEVLGGRLAGVLADLGVGNS